LSEDCQGVRLILRAGVVRGQLGLLLLWVGVSQDRFLLSACSILIMCGADGVSFVESLPQQFVMGKNRPGGGHGSRSPPITKAIHHYAATPGHVTPP